MSALACAANMDHYLKRLFLLGLACLLPIWRCFDGPLVFSFSLRCVGVRPHPKKKNLVHGLLKNVTIGGWPVEVGEILHIERVGSVTPVADIPTRR